MRTALFGLLLVVMASVGALAQGPEKSTLDLFRSYRACVEVNAEVLDDGRSDPSSVAEGILGECWGPFDDYVALVTKANSDAADKLKSSMRTQEHDYAVAQVLHARLSAKAKRSAR